MKCLTAVLALSTLMAAAACGGDSTGPDTSLEIEGSYAGVWKIGAVALNTGEATGCFNGGGLEITSASASDLSGSFHVDSAASCLELDFAGDLVPGTVASNGEASFGLEVTDAVVMMQLPVDIFEFLAAQFRCEVLSARDMTGTFADDRLIASGWAAFGCADTSVRLDLELDLIHPRSRRAGSASRSDASARGPAALLRV